jgi:hypothetical protein
MQNDDNRITVRLPDNYDPAHRYPVVYLLPCEAGAGDQYGDPLHEVCQLSPALRERCFFVKPSFATIPWYGHHVTDQHIRHDAILRTEVIPWVEAHYATTGVAGRLLFGLSKSGWGAISLLARYPDFFSAAASWDAPLLMDRDCFGAYGTAEHFGSAEHFAQFLPPTLYRANPWPFQQRTRVVLSGHQAFGNESMPPGAGHCHTEGMHALFTELAIPHHYQNDLIFPHAWLVGWMEPVLRALLSLTIEQ